MNPIRKRCTAKFSASTIIDQLLDTNNNSNDDNDEEVLKSIFSILIEQLTLKPKFKLNNEYIVDVTECTIQRSKTKEIQKEYYSGKKKKQEEKPKEIPGVYDGDDKYDIFKGN